MTTVGAHLRRIGVSGLRRRLVRDQRGFTLIEMMIASSIFIGVAAALAGILGSSIVAHDLARERTFAQQAVTAQIECVRRLAYQDVGLYPSGNPRGKVGYTGGGDFCKGATSTISKTGLTATMTTTIDYVDDKAPNAPTTAADYKKVTVTVTRSDGRVLASQVTFVAPVQRAPYGGINNAILNVTVMDYGLNQPVQDATVSLASGPSAPLSDTTDALGLASFAALTPTTTSGAATDFYDITATKSGYTTLPADLPPASAAHKVVDPSATVPATIRIYKGATIDVNLLDGAGGPAYTGAVTVKVTSDYTSTTQSYAMSGGAGSITTFEGVPVVPKVNYTLRAYTTTGLCADPITQEVPDDYPTTLTTSYTLELEPCDVGTVIVNVNQLGGPANAATVTLQGGPNDYAPITQSTDVAGQTTFTNLPSGAETYAIDALKLYATGATTAVVTTGSTTTVTINLPDPPIGNIRAHVTWLGSAVVGASVRVTGGPGAVDQTLSTDGAGDAVFLDLPSGVGYTVEVTKNGIVSTQSGVSISTGATTVVNFTMPTATLTVNVTWAGQHIGSGGAVTVTGGPMGGSYAGSTNSSGVATITVPRSATDAYTVAASKSGGSGSTTVATIPGATASANIAFTQVGTITVTATWASLFSAAANVSITGGPISGVTYGTGTTTAAGTGIAPAITVPVTSSTPFTISVSKSSGTGTGTVSTVTSGSNVPATVAITPTKTLNVTIQRGGVNAGSGLQVTLSLTGGPNGVSGAAPAYQLAGTTDGSSRVSIVVPAGSGTYTIKGYTTLCPTSPSTANRSRSNTVSAASGTTTFTLNLNSTTCPLTLP